MTRQVSDNLIYEGEMYPLLSFISLPENDARVVKLTDEEFKLLFSAMNKEWSELQLKIDSHRDSKDTVYTLTDEESGILKKHYSNPLVTCSSTACWRKYIATWEVKDGSLYLKEIHGMYKLLSEAPIIVDWYTDILKIGLGEKLDSNMILASGDIYKNERHIIIDKGIVTHIEEVEFNEEYEELDGTVKSRPKDRRSILRKFLDDGE